MNTHWPEHLVDTKRVFGFITEHLGIAGQSTITRKHHLALSLEHAIERAHQGGVLRRFVVKDPTSGEVIGHGYHRDELKDFLRTHQAAVDRAMSKDL